MGKKKFVEKVYFKIIVNLQTQQILNGNSYGLVTKPETQSFILTTKETGHKYLKEKPDTIVTEIIYAIPNNPLNIPVKPSPKLAPPPPPTAIKIA